MELFFYLFIRMDILKLHLLLFTFVSIVSTMRKLIALSIFLYFSLHLSAQINQKDNKGQKQGEWKEYYQDTILKSKGVYKNGKRVGVWHFYYETGEVFMEVEYLTDGITTNMKMFDPNGMKTAEGIYVKAKKEGTWYYYATDSTKLREETYKNSLLDGLIKTYYRSGKLFEQIAYVRGKKEGIWKQYFESGVLKVDGTYKNDTLDGKIIYYHPNTKKMLEGLYKRGLREGTFTIYEENGKVKDTYRYNNGIMHPDDRKKKINGDIKEVFPESIIYQDGYENLAPK